MSNVLLAMTATTAVAALAPSIDPNRRTVVQIPVQGDPWPTILAWAKRKSFTPRASADPHVKLFQRGTGALTAPIRLEVSVINQVVTLTAWLPLNLFVRIMALFMLPAEMHIRSGGFKAVIPRATARKAVNELIAELGGQPIA